MTLPDKPKMHPVIRFARLKLPCDADQKTPMRLRCSAAFRHHRLPILFIACTTRQSMPVTVHQLEITDKKSLLPINQMREQLLKA